MKTFIFLAIVLFFFSCEKDDNQPVIVSFPATLVYDTIEVIENEVFNKSGKLLVYDEKFDVFEYMPMSLFDSLRIIDRNIAISFDSVDGRYNGNSLLTDTFSISISGNYFQAIPMHLSTLILKIDTKVESNIVSSTNKEEIEKAETALYLKESDNFFVELYAVRVFTQSTGLFGDFSMAQICTNSVNKEDLYKNLESNEILSIVKFRKKFSKK